MQKLNELKFFKLNFIKEIKIVNIAGGQNRSRLGSCNHSEMCELQRDGVGHN